MEKNKTAKLIIKNIMKKYWVYSSSLLIGVTISGVVNGAAYTEVLRRITQSIWDGERGLLISTLYLFSFIIIVNFLLNMIQRRNIFLLKMKLTCACEDTIYEVYSKKEYWIPAEQDEVLGHMRKIVPSTMGSVITQMIESFRIGVIIVSGCIYGICLDANIVIISMALTCGMVFFSRKAMKQAAELFKEFGVRNSRLDNLLWEQVRNREIAKFLDQDKVVDGYVKESSDFLNILLKIKKATNGTGLFSQFSSTILIIVVSLLGGTLVLRGKMQGADLLALITLVPVVSAQLFRIPEQIQRWIEVRSNCANINALLEEGDKREGSLNLSGQNIAEIEIRNLTFSYVQNDVELLRNINLNLVQGRIYTLAGASGCGKSTLLKLIARMIPYQQGEIFVNKRPLKQMDREKYWDQVSMIEQNPVIVPGTLLYNITLDEDSYNTERMKQAIRDANLETFVKERPEGLQSVLTEKSLSKGEIVRINLARVFYRNAACLLLDEITEGLDPNSELRIMKALKRRTEEDGLLVLCISHRVAVLSAADQVIYMKAGQVARMNTHQTLLDVDDEYRELVQEVAE